MRFLLPAILTALLIPCAPGHGEDEYPVPHGEEDAHLHHEREGGPSYVLHFSPPSREQIAMRMMIRHLLLVHYDANHDQQLDGHERHRLVEDARGARQRHAQDFIRRFDADEDGHLSPSEHEALRHAMETRRRAMEEAPAFLPHAEHEKPHPHRGHHPHMGKRQRLITFMVQQLIMDEYDADRDGQLDREENAHLRADGAWLYETREAELLSHYDEDRDGVLSEDELHTAFDALFPYPHSPHAEGGAHLPLPPPPHHHRRGSLNRLLDTHFDIDILLHLAHPQAESGPRQPCAPSTPSEN